MNLLITIVGIGIFCLLAEIINLKKIIIPVTVVLLLALFGLQITNNLPEITGFENMIQMNTYAKVFSSLFILLTALLIILSAPTYKKSSKLSDFIAVKVFMLSGAVAMVGFSNMAMFFLGIEVLSIGLYILAGSERLNIKSNEAGMKYFLMGSFASGILLFGIALLYGATGYFDIATLYEASTSANTEYWFYFGVILITIGMLFKVAATPMHFWAPDVYEGSPTQVTALMSTFAKVAAMASFYKLVTILISFMEDSYKDVIVVIIVATMFFGNVMALRQKKIKRILAYSGISHTGFMLMTLLNTAVTEGNLLYYATTYSFAGLAAFAVVLLVTRKEDNCKIENFNGLAKREPLMAFIMTIATLSMAGIPILAGFFGKFFILQQVMADGYIGLSIFAIINSMIAVFYYFKVIFAMYTKEQTEDNELSTKTEYYVVAIVCCIMLIILGLFPNQVLNLL
jgi:NADH-quinone oxidoreductase subunit N